ncbi:MAG TPA: hypothetical protein VJA21_14045 [Verrucomicrobiae bacterium]
MGFLGLFSSRCSPDVQMLPSGSLTVDRDAQILASTVSSAVSEEVLHDIGSRVLQLFRQARNAQIPITQLTLNFASLQITARELRGGAMIFLTPKHSFNVSPRQKA